MGTKAGITLEQVVETAETIADRDGFSALTLAAVAAGLGIKSPSLYSYVDGLAGLRRQLMIRAAGEMHRRFAAAVDGLEGFEAVRSLAAAYRQFAIERPGMYDGLLERAPRPGEDDEVYVALGRPVEVVEGVLSGLGVDPAVRVHLVRGLRSMLHGFVDIENKSGFGRPVDIDQSFETAVEMVVNAIVAAID